MLLFVLKIYSGRNSSLNGFSFDTVDDEDGYYKDGAFHPFGNPYLRYNEDTGYVEVMKSDGTWIQVYKTPNLPVVKNFAPSAGETFSVGGYTYYVLSNNGTRARVICAESLGSAAIADALTNAAKTTNAPYQALADSFYTVSKPSSTVNSSDCSIMTASDLGGLTAQKDLSSQKSGLYNFLKNYSFGWIPVATIADSSTGYIYLINANENYVTTSAQNVARTYIPCYTLLKE